MTLDELKEYLDGAICNWRVHRDAAEKSAEVKGDAWTERDKLVAECYIDAFQSVRTTVFGELL